MGLSRKSPTTAPKDLVKINTAQNKNVREIFVIKFSAIIATSNEPKIIALHKYQKPRESVLQSLRGVPKVCENIIVIQQNISTLKLFILLTAIEPKVRRHKVSDIISKINNNDKPPK